MRRREFLKTLLFVSAYGTARPLDSLGCVPPQKKPSFEEALRKFNREWEEIAGDEWLRYYNKQRRKRGLPPVPVLNGIPRPHLLWED